MSTAAVGTEVPRPVPLWIKRDLKTPITFLEVFLSGKGRVQNNPAFFSNYGNLVAGILLLENVYSDGKASGDPDGNPDAIAITLIKILISS